MQFAKVPAALDFVDIVHLTNAAVRYDACSLLTVYMEKWLAPYRGRLLSPGYEEWLFVAHHFEYKTEYAELAMHLAMNCRMDSAGEGLVAPGASDALAGKIPVDTLTQIYESRKLIISKILKGAYDLWASMSRGSCKVTCEGDPDAQRSCAALNLIVLTNYLRELGLFPMLGTETGLERSPKQLATELSGTRAAMRIAETVSMGRRGSAPKPADHVRCHVGLQLKSITCRVLEDVSWPMEIPTTGRDKNEGGAASIPNADIGNPRRRGKCWGFWKKTNVVNEG
ncbi:hypothetical protein OPT61_g10672 [Boeremia exigua]|uniref:Uncharacterized protein n=1 Tax=Boeremia exigua TaxID=749465 RepID=A0ACC2HNF1_9PLEO|nr:hypothetical protein OPT61_g10672 [Boeremia exigua]